MFTKHVDHVHATYRPQLLLSLHASTSHAMTNRLPGAAYLFVRAQLEHPRIISERERSMVTFDAIIQPSRAGNGSPLTCPSIVCSLYCITTNGADQIQTGVYDIEAKVCDTFPVPTLLTTNSLSLIQVVTFRPGTHQRSPVRHDREFDFMGDLLNVRN
jgi:hypothetical protein